MRGVWAGAKTVIFNGDTVNWAVTRESARLGQIVEGLEAVCAVDGVKPIFVAGNTDGRISTCRHLLLSEGRVMVSHGDVIFPEVSPWRIRAARFRRARIAALEGMAPDRRGTLEGQLAAAMEANMSVRVGKEVGFGARIIEQVRFLGTPLRTLGAWRRAPSLAVEFLGKYVRQARCMVIGHTHRPGIWQQDDRIVVNTGSFRCPHCPWVVCLDNGTLTVRKIVRERGNYILGKEMGQFSL